MASPELPRVAVRMRRDHVEALPDWPMPPGFTLRGMAPEEVPAWVEVWSDADASLNVSAETFAKVFGDDWSEIGERCLLLREPAGPVIGTVSAWREGDDPAIGRVHWVAIRRGWQGRGLSKPLMAEAMRRIARLRHRSMVLDTHAHRLSAIALYLSCGFAPDPGWNATGAAWELALAALSRT